MVLGILKESYNERRVAMLPESVAALVKMNVSVIVEKDAGLSAFASDVDYISAGAKLDSKSNVIIQSDVLVKINPPTEEEKGLLTEGKVFLAVLNPFFNAAPSNYC